MKNKINTKKIVIIIALIITAVRILLMINIPMYFIGDAGYDDELFVEYADNILKGNWLGGYDNRRLIKGISFAIFLLVINVLNIPYLFALSVFYIFAAILVTKVLSYKVKNKWILLATYVFFLYSPSGFAFNITQRFYRNSLIVPLIVILFASIFGIYFNYKDNIKSSIKYSILCGLALSFFYYLREDSVWVLPFVIVALAVIFVLIFKKYKFKYIYCTLIPIILLIITTLIISTINYVYYGVFITNDRTSSAFGDMCKNLLKIDSEEKDNIYWVTEDMFRKAIEVSPTLQTIESGIDEIYNDEGSLSYWKSGEDELRGDMFVWALREAMSLCGIYTSAEEVEAFCEQINQELEEAVENDSLVIDDDIYLSATFRGISISEIPTLFVNTLKNLWLNITYDVELMKSDINSSGTDAQIRKMEIYTMALGFNPSEYDLVLSGSVTFLEGSDCIGYAIVDDSGNILYSSITNMDNSFDIQETGIESSDIYIELYYNNQESELIEIDNYENQDVIITLNSYSVSETTDDVSTYKAWVIKISNLIIKFYQIISVPVFILCMISYIIYLIYNIKIKNFDNIIFSIAILGVLLSILLLCGMVTVFTEWLGEIQYKFYSVGALALIQLFEVFGLVMLVEMLSKLSKKKRGLINESNRD